MLWHDVMNGLLAGTSRCTHNHNQSSYLVQPFRNSGVARNYVMGGRPERPRHEDRGACAEWGVVWRGRPLPAD